VLSRRPGVDEFLHVEEALAGFACMSSRAIWQRSNAVTEAEVDGSAKERHRAGSSSRLRVGHSEFFLDVSVSG